jgi:hypothetical protein
LGEGLIDRFGQSLPDRWRPRPDYEVMFQNDRDYRDYLQQSLGAPPKSVGTYADIMALTVKQFERGYLFGSPLPAEGWPEPSPGQWAAAHYWESSLRGGKSHLSFPVIGRLAELLLRLNPMARDALRLTYSHLFMDEFQDATQVQYDLVRAIFLGADTIVTAVGDNKQQIMRWAMAMDDPFAAFDADFKAKRTPLYNNYRSSPELVRIQHILAQALDAKSVKPVSKTAAVLQPAFAAAGIPLRNEAGQAGAIMLQELLAEEASELIICVLRLAMTARAGRHWTECQEALGSLRGIGPDDEVEQARFAKELDAYSRRLGRDHLKPPSTEAAARKLVDDVLGFVGRGRLVAAHPAYGQGDWLEKVLASAATHLAQSAANAGDWTGTLDAYEGLHAIPLMTIHKSKGLEYHTVIFAGLDDGAWWSFAGDQVEATAGFFVAFTRAKQRVVFTYCARRGARTKIATLYNLLAQAGVQTFKVA